DVYDLDESNNPATTTTLSSRAWVSYSCQGRIQKGKPYLSSFSLISVCSIRAIMLSLVKCTLNNDGNEMKQ
ncbi:hypothetical protein MKW98_010425, partial [Papaver atlanticum]